MSTATTLSVIVITKNEQDSLLRCLQSVAWAQEWIVVDSGSTDQTVSIAQNFGARVVQTAEWPGFGPQKNYALSLATSDWVLSLDADESLSPELSHELLLFLREPKAMLGGIFPRESSFSGVVLRHGGWWPDPVVRLVKRHSGQFSLDLVHERLIIKGPLHRFSHPIHHATYEDFSEALSKANHYSSLGAEQAYALGKRSSFTQALLRASWAFWRTLIWRKSFLDGSAGWLLACYNSYTTFSRYIKLWELGRNHSSTDK